MTYARLSPFPLAFAAALGGCGGSAYPVGSEEHGAGGATVGTVSSGGATSVSSTGAGVTGGLSSVVAASSASAGGAISVGGASSSVGAGGVVHTGGAANTGGASQNTTGTAPTTGGAANTGGTPARTGGAANSGGNANSTGGAVTTGGIANGTGGTLAAGGTATGLIRSLAAVVDFASNRFVAYDAEGQLVHDYTPLLNALPDGYAARIVSIDGKGWAWDGPDPSYASIKVAPPGKYPPLAASEMFVTARLNSSSFVRIADVSGTAIDEWTMSGDWQLIRPSPSRGYVLGTSGISAGVLVRRSDHAPLWQGPAFQAAFSPDDQHLIVSANYSATAFTLIDTSNGQTRSVNLNTLPTGFGLASAGVEGATNAGAIVTIRRSDNMGQALFWVSWDGSIVPFDTSVPKPVEEYVSRTNGDDTRVLWWRNQYSSSMPVDPSLLGWFELDLTTMTNRAVPNLSATSGDCYDSTTYYKLDGATLLSCACDSGACTSLASPPAPLESAWLPNVSVSPLRGVIGYGYDWPLNRMPETTATARLYAPQGALLASFDAGWLQYDRLDQLVITSGSSIVSVSTGKQTSLGTTRGNTTVVYE